MLVCPILAHSERKTKRKREPVPFEGTRALCRAYTVPLTVESMLQVHGTRALAENRVRRTADRHLVCGYLSATVYDGTGRVGGAHPRGNQRAGKRRTFKMVNWFILCFFSGCKKDFV